MQIRKITINLREEDCQWLETVYGEEWTKRMEQHIANEVRVRREYEEEPLKMRKPWNY